MKFKTNFPVIVILALSGLLLFCTNKQQKKFPEKKWEQKAIPAVSEEDKQRYHLLLSHFFDTALLKKESSFNGGILVAKSGIILFEHYQGFEQVSTLLNPVTDSSAMHIASTSKTFTAMAILKLIQEKKLSLPDYVSTYLPTLPYPGITVRDLLTHRSGIPSYLDFMEKANWEKKGLATNQDVLNVMAKVRPKPTALPNEKFEYCNTNYLLLALVIEKISGQSYPSYLQSIFFDPLGMHNTFVYSPSARQRSTDSYLTNGEKWPLHFLDQTYGDKNIYSTPRDLLRWDQSLYSNELIDSSLRQQAFQGYSVENPGTDQYGFGFRLEILPSGKKIIYHFGRWHGNNAAFARLPDEQVVIIILGNRFNREIYKAARKAYQLFGEYTIPAEKKRAN